MIRKLQLRFILLSMSALFIVLGVIIAAMNVINYRSIVLDADELLAILSENKGAFPSAKEGKGGALPRDLSPETPYESRYFSVLLDSGSGAVIQTETGRIAAVDTSAAIEYAREALARSRSKGFIGELRYARYEEGGVVRVIFLDCGRKLASFRSFLRASTGISCIGYAVVLLLISVFSGRIIRPLSESYARQKRFITDAGHEMKTPLTIIQADADILEMEHGGNEWVADIQKQAKRLSALTSDLIYLARMEEAEHSMPMIDFPLSDVVSETAFSFQAPAQTQGKSFSCSIQPMLSMKGSDRAIQELVAILLDNAIKYSPENGRVSLTLEKQGRTLRLSVFNTLETSLPAEELGRLFERFYRADPSRSSQTGGYGIGLSVARAIVAAHGGRIQAETPKEEASLRITALFPA
ncbi:MAG: ATP-binding protein [Clostridia bacterium]|nr:ATP-binding protein [Clostridia bacterium]